MISTCVIALIMYVVVFIRTRPDASAFTSSLALSYFLFLQWSAMSQNNDPKCNPYHNLSSSSSNGSLNTILMMVFGLIFTFVSLLVISTQTRKLKEQNITTSLNQAMMEKEDNDKTIGKKCDI